MDFLKKHYEKILLGVVLVGLVGGLVVLLLKIGADREALRAKEESKVNPHVQALSNLDLTIAQDALKLVSTPAVIDFGPPNRLSLLNPSPCPSPARSIRLVWRSRRKKSPSVRAS